MKPQIKKRQIIMFYGGPGSGKGTQAKLLAKKLKAPFFSVGEELRKIASKNTALARQVNKLIDKGSFVPNYISGAIVATQLKKGGNLIFDGYPRNIGQAYDLNRLLGKMAPNASSYFVFLDVPVGELKKRLKARIVKEGRDDDRDLEAMNQRFKIFNEKRGRLLDYFAGKGWLQTVDGIGSIEQVHKRVLQAVTRH